MEVVAFNARTKEIELICEIDPSVPEIAQGDGQRLRQILVNLLNNAVKFSTQGEVILRASSVDLEDGRCIIQCSVQDQGIGIPSDRQPLLFRAFTQGDSSLSRQYVS